MALIINEFGDLGVDGEILKGCGESSCNEDDVVELANGCICCTVADDFVPTMEALLDRPEPPDHIIIETSGLALPKPLVKAFNWPEIRPRVTVDGVITVVDGPAVAEGRFAGDPQAVQAQRESDDALDHDSPLEELFEDQLNCADLVLLNKTDLLSDADLQGLSDQLGDRLRPEVRLLRSSHGAIDASVLLGLTAGAEDDLAARPSHHDGVDDHEHDDFSSFVIELDEQPAPADLVALLNRLWRDHGVLRVKGFAAVAGKDMRLVVQGVGGRLQHHYDRDWRPDEARRTHLVIIGLAGMDQAAVRGALQDT